MTRRGVRAMRLRWWATLLVIVLVACTTTRGDDVATTKAVATLDADKWARRNVELLHYLLDVEGEAEGVSCETALSFSMQFNPLLLRDPHAAEFLKVLEAYRPKAKPQVARAVELMIEALKKPQAERLNSVAELRSKPPTGEDKPGAKRRPQMPEQVASRIAELPAGQRERLTPGLVAEMEAAAAERKDWGGLGLAYLRLARDAERRGDRAEVDRYTKRLLEIVREHPVFQDPSRGNTDAPDPARLASLMLDIGRRDELETFMRGQGDDARTELGIGLIAVLAGRGDFDGVRPLIQQYVRPSRPEAADRLTAALKGELVLPAPEKVEAGKRATRESASELRLREALGHIGSGHAARGQVETAGRMYIALQRDEVPVRPGRLFPYEWSGLAMTAAEHGHRDAARIGFERAVEMMEREGAMEPAERKDKAEMVREAVSIEDYETANRMLNTSSAPGAWARLQLAKRYRARGDTKQAMAKLDDALKIAYQSGNRAGAQMAGIAVELQEMGERERSARTLLDALGRIEGVDFGFGGTAAVVDAAVKMKRTDLLDRLYDTSDAGSKLLLCLTACSRSMVTKTAG